MRAVSDLSKNSHRGSSAPPSFSVVIPTHNEEADIAAALRAIVAQRFAASEVIVVDGGSTDRTLEIVARFTDQLPVVVIPEGRRRGVSAARNAGIRRAAGDVVIILNADALLPVDFLECLADKYSGPVDLVTVESCVVNQDVAIGRYLQADHEERFGPTRRQFVGWSEGFSCRRDAALAVGFPEEIPGAGGEDGEFFRRLIDAGYRWEADFSLVVPHRVPDTRGAFWWQWRSRGNAVPYFESGVRGKSLAAVTARRSAAAAVSCCQLALLVPALVGVVRRVHRSSWGWRDFPSFWLLYHLQLISHRVGEWQSVVRLWRQRLESAP